MKKMLMWIVVIGLLGFSAAPSALAAVPLQIDIHQPSGEVTIQGTVPGGSGREVTVWVQSPEGTIAYINQLSSGPGGEFTFRYTVESGRTGTYEVNIGGEGILSPVVVSFDYKGEEEPQEPGRPEEPQEPGRPEEPQEPGRPEEPQEPGRPEEPQEPGRPEEPGTPGSPGDSDRGSGGTIGAGPEGEENHGELAETDDGVKYTPGPSAMRIGESAGRKAVTIVTLSKHWVDQALQAFSERQIADPMLTVEVDVGHSVHLELPGEALRQVIGYRIPVTISLVTPYGHYDFPLSVLMDRTNGADALTLGIELKELEGSWLEQADSYAAPYGLRYVVSLVKNGRMEEITEFGHIFIHRGIALLSDVDPNKATGVLMDSSSNTLHFVPTVFHDKEGRAYAELKRSGNSVYTVVNNDRSFQDTANHWAKDDIEQLASKLIVNGRTGNQYAPQEQVTRAEFTAMLVRSLGILPHGFTGEFQDVQSDDWFAGVVAAAVQRGLIRGYEDSTFRPSQEITREEMAIMLNRAVQFAGSLAAKIDTPAERLHTFDDRHDISWWALDAVTQAVDSRLINGRTPTRIMPKELATRAETAVMIRRMLQQLEFIN